MQPSPATTQAAWPSPVSLSAVGPLPAVGPGAPPGPPTGQQPGEAALRAALLDSRQRWRGFVALGSDWAFETDSGGRFTFVWPEGVLGWPEASLLGRKAADLLAVEMPVVDGRNGGVQEGAGFDPFGVCQPTRGQAAWVRAAGGGPVLMRFSVEPACGGGVRGVATDMTSCGRETASHADALRRAELVGHVVDSMREEVLGGRMVAAMLREAVLACGADGAALVTNGFNGLMVRHSTGEPPADVLAALGSGELTGAEGLAVTRGGMLACPVPERLRAGATLVFWRGGAARAWTADDAAVAMSLTAVVRTVLEQDDVQHELARQARTDPLTGLLNRRAFTEELDRRMERVQSGQARGVLITVDLDGFKPVNDQYGHETGDAVLVAVAMLLRHTFRPTDLLARLGGDEFTVWLDGADELTAAERADELCGTVVDATSAVLPPDAAPVTMSIGIAVADPTSDALDDVLRRADAAMFAAKSAGRGVWQVDAGAGWAGGERSAA